jgi:hypothetical protein
MPAMAEIWDWVVAAIGANPLGALLLIALGPILIVAFARNDVGAIMIIVGTIIGLVVAFTTNALLPVLSVFGLLWLVAIGFVIFGRPLPAK